MARRTKSRASTRSLNLDRARAVSDACAVEQAAFNDAVKNQGKTALLSTAFGMHEVVAVYPDWSYLTYPLGRAHRYLEQRTFAGCNNDKWADLLRQVGVKRHPLFAAYA